jgi:hypothetical protein
MSDTEILDFIIERNIWVHPSGHGGWTASEREYIAWNQPSLRDAVHKLQAEILSGKPQDPDPL